MSGSEPILQLVGLISQNVDEILRAYAAAGAPVPTLASTDASASLDTQPIRAAVRVLEGACAQLIATLAPAPHVMLNRAHAGVDPACIRVALSANIAEQLRSGPKPVSELAKTGEVETQQLGRVLRTLAVKHCFTEVTTDVYANNRLSACLLPERNASSIIGLITDEANASYPRLFDALSKPEWHSSTSGETCAYVLAHGKPVFVRHEEETWRSERFSRAMIEITNILQDKNEIPTMFPWNTVKRDSTICDVGGALGHVSMSLLKAHPHLKSIVQDQAHVLQPAESFWRDELPTALDHQRVKFEPIDFLKQSPVPGCDIYFLKNVLHDWTDTDCVKILKNVREAMTTNPGSRLLINEFVLHDATRTTATDGARRAPEPLLPNFGAGAQIKYFQDILMLAAFNARERTVGDFIRISKNAGFRFVKLWDGELGLLELIPE